MAVSWKLGVRDRTFSSFADGIYAGKMVSLLYLTLFGIVLQGVSGQIDSSDAFRGLSSCYDSNGRAQRCTPEFVNAAFGLPVEATNTCGTDMTEEYCLQTGVTGATKACNNYCDSRRPGYNHPPEFMTDFNNNYNWTWWQSQTMLEGTQYPNVVNLTLHFKKAFSITYVRIRFHSPRPESFAIYKRNGAGPWVPYQFYSGSCEKTYNLPRRGVITRENEAVAICTDEFSDISPLTGGSVAFSTLEGRPSSTNFGNSPILQDWVTATDIKIVLTRMNTFGDEVFGDPQVLKSYFYAISDLSVGAMCQCNGHASECYKVKPNTPEEQQICKCEHNTTGPNCQECLPFFNDRPWSRAYGVEANECLPCNCNGLSNQCYFDTALYRQTGHGGHCENCRDNTDGVNCEQCRLNHYRKQPENRCIDCQCNEVGSEDMQCNEIGQCRCKPGVTGDKCDRCAENFYEFGPLGCKPCSCSVAGSVDGALRCDPRNGACSCKVNVEGQNCDMCKPGYFGLSEDNPFGCLKCFCFGHSSVCDTSPSFYARSITTDFETGKQRWTGMNRRNQEIPIRYNAILQNVGVSAPDTDSVYFNAPARYLGDQRFSYNQHLTFNLKIGEDTARASVVDIVLDGAGQTISLPIFAQNNPVPSIIAQEYKYRLSEDPKYQWTPRINSEDFMAILANLTALKIRATYNANGVGFIDNIQLETARRGFDGGEEAVWVESCTCPEGYVGQFCESCGPGFKRDVRNGGPFAGCVPCECNGHSDVCDVNTGGCICQHNTMGDFCDRCISGYYGDARGGTSEDCKPCPCPGGSACVLTRKNDVVCTECPEGYGGNRCELCLDGYFGDPNGLYSERRPCQKCFCNENIDPNAVGNCNSTTGECRKCIYNTAGFYCEKCLPDYYGDALSLPKGDCEACNCFESGTQEGSSCDQTNGQCRCLPHITGDRCDVLEIGYYWQLNATQGAEACNCDTIGSTNTSCDPYTGQCMCKPGVSGLRCDACQRYSFGFSIQGCTACDCAPEGSLDYQCNEYGNCPCRTNVDGRRCDRCAENKFNISAGCLDCPPCYDLVQERVNIHRSNLRDLWNLIKNIEDNPGLFNDTEFLSHLTAVNKSVNILLEDARSGSTGDGTIGQQLSELRKALSDVLSKCGKITKSIMVASDVSEQSAKDIKLAEEAIDRAETALRAAEEYIDHEGKMALKRALEALQRFGRQSEQMTRIAQRAARESERQMEDANRIYDVANDALNMSRQALQLANNAFSQPEETALEINRLQQDYESADRLYTQTKLVAERAQDLAKEAHEDALKLYSEAQRQVPKLDISEFNSEVDQIKEEAALIKSEAERLIEQNKELLEDVEEKQKMAEIKLENGTRLQQRTDELLAEVDAARATARDAVRMGDKTLMEADETLKTLIGFDKLVQESKGKADDALDKIPDIEKIIKKAEDTTYQTNSALSGAQIDANEALNLAVQAETTAKDASQEASRIRLEANQTKNKAVELKEEADLMADDIADADAQLTELEKQAMEDTELSKQALEKANEAKLTAEEASAKINEALNTVQNIIRKLGSTDGINSDELDQLEKDLNEVENNLNATYIEEEYNKLTKANEQIKIWSRRYSADYSQLEADVDNIEEIRNSLPDGCFKTIEIESPAGRR